MGIQPQAAGHTATQGFGQDEIQRADEIGSCIDESAVEIEDNKGGGGHGGSLAGEAGSCKGCGRIGLMSGLFGRF